MTDLHYALLAVAGVLLVLLYGYNKWQERRMLRELDASLRGGVGDPLMQSGPPRQPSGSVAAAAAATAGAGAADATPGMPVPAPVEVTDLPLSALYGGRVEPRFEMPAAAESVGAEADAAPTAAETAAAASAPRWVEDPMIDWVLELRCAHAVDGVAVMEAVAALQRQKFALPVFVAAWDARTQQWVHADRFGFYSELLAAIQLANRRVALDAIEASRFLSAVQQLAVALDADFDAPDVARVCAAADALAATCARFDVQIGLTLEASAGRFDPARIAAAAAAAHLVAAGAGRWERRDADGAALFTLASAASERLALELDVPLAPAASAPLRTMFATAESLAASLGARIVDDNGAPVDAAALAAVEAQLEALYAQMRQAGIEPASPRARRLYA